MLLRIDPFGVPQTGRYAIASATPRGRAAAEQDLIAIPAAANNDRAFLDEEIHQERVARQRQRIAVPDIDLAAMGPCPGNRRSRLRRDDGDIASSCRPGADTCAARQPCAHRRARHVRLQFGSGGKNDET